MAAWVKCGARVPPRDVGATRIRRSDGVEIDASFRVTTVDGVLAIIVESGGGTRGTSAARNRDYKEGLELLLERLKALDARIIDATVESNQTRSLSPEDKRIRIPEGPYPLQIDDPAVLRKNISSAQAKVGRAPGAKGGGNQNKRIQLLIELPDAMVPERVGRTLGGPPAVLG